MFENGLMDLDHGKNQVDIADTMDRQHFCPHCPQCPPEINAANIEKSCVDDGQTDNRNFITPAIVKRDIHT